MSSPIRVGPPRGRTPADARIAELNRQLNEAREVMRFVKHRLDILTKFDAARGWVELSVARQRIKDALAANPEEPDES